MLADRVTNLSRVEQLMKEKPFFVETKYDGERLQVGNDVKTKKLSLLSCDII